MNKQEFVSQIENAGPVLVGTYAVGRIEVGSRVNAEKGGIKETFATIVSTVISNRKGYEVKTNLRGDEVQNAVLAAGRNDAEDKLLPCVPMTPCYVQISSVKNDKGKVTISGKVVPFGQSGTVAAKK